ncbi:Zinc finger C3HC4-type RING finger family protein [Quillaja saponaria]|uniref:Zinc finger C3HC4-type RING finger family protein n=1 Tax=Quillaja saponaria TaxID=32244 RepID=A0AAD7PAM7_QUISA|nr:Zinc finger C3HC4-type RING finger family protein [Quillaja saponaria]
MGSKWRKVKLALGLNMCVYAPRASEDPSPSINVAARVSDASSPSSVDSPAPTSSICRPTTLTPSSSGIRLSKSGPKPSKGTCAICLTSLKPGQGHAIFTAECSHSFHFHCITSNVKHGNQICPVCRAKWKEVPFQSPASDVPQGMSRMNQVSWPEDDAWMNVVGQLPFPQVDASRQSSSMYHGPEPAIFDDDEALGQEPLITSNDDKADNNSISMMEIRTYPELSAVPRSAAHGNFTVLIHLKAPPSIVRQNSGRNETNSPPVTQNFRAPVDLVTVLDVSGSMAGTKLALLKRAMGFVIQNLGPTDRLSVIAFSSTARRIFPLQRMTNTGRQQALLAVNSLVSNGGTNIAEALSKGAKVFVDRTWKNPVGSIILLSDGQDTYSVKSPSVACTGTSYQSLVPSSIRRNNGTVLQIPVHAFGFGADHDATSMHSISEMSGGTFSFIEAEGVIQDAFAQCIGGLLSVVVQEVQVKVDCVHPSLQVCSIKAGSYQTSMTGNARKASICVGDLYAEEERDFLVTVNIPVDFSSDEMSLLKVRCIHRDPITKEMVAMQEKEASEVKIRRPEVSGELAVSIEVDRQRNRLCAAEAMAEARVAAERGDLAGAVSVLDGCHKALSETASAHAGDRLCVALSAELKEMQERMASRRVYEESGRAYVLSGLSSHSWQRATARGDFTDSTSLVQAYQTPSMVDMLTRSQTMVLGNPSARRTLRPVKSLPARPQAR